MLELGVEESPKDPPTGQSQAGWGDSKLCCTFWGISGEGLSWLLCRPLKPKLASLLVLGAWASLVLTGKSLQWLLLHRQVPSQGLGMSHPCSHRMMNWGCCMPSLKPLSEVMSLLVSRYILDLLLAVFYWP